ncbi:MAG TPA: Ig-like domain-containing protein [Terriglobales bacterium]|nr:Ig-like domain-containing protein [Terriglobales bacterium]
MKVFSSLMLLVALAMALGCGTQNCPPQVLAVEPATGSANHTSIAPGNQLQFTAKWTITGNDQGCYYMQAMPSVTWTTSDAVNTTISATGLATCVNATSQPATITATEVNGQKATATLTCQ